MRGVAGLCKARRRLKGCCCIRFRTRRVQTMSFLFCQDSRSFRMKIRTQTVQALFKATVRVVSQLSDVTPVNDNCQESYRPKERPPLKWFQNDPGGTFSRQLRHFKLVSLLSFLCRFILKELPASFYFFLWSSLAGEWLLSDNWENEDVSVVVAGW